MNFAQRIDFNALMEPVALRLLGEPTQKHANEWRYGSRGSRVIDIVNGRWFDHEANKGGGVFDLIRCHGHDQPAAWLRSEGLIGFSKIVKTYDYRDEIGELLFQVVRFEPKDFRQRRPGGCGWIWKLGDARRVLYLLPELVKAVAAGQTIYIPEGEKDVDNLRAIGLAATTNPGGIKKWRAEYSEYLRGADIVVLPDNHAEGREHGDQVVASLHGIAKRIRILDIGKHWGGCPDKGDISDWIAAGVTAEKLKAMADALPDVAAPADNHSSEQKSAEDCAAVQKGQPLSIADFLVKELPERKNIIDPWLPEKGLGMIYSPRGVGKTLFGLGSGYAISAAETFLGFEVEAPQKVLYVDGEMPARVMQERLAAIVRGFGKQPPSENHFRLLCADLFEFGLPDLATPAGQAWLDARIGDTNVIFLDNISTLVRSGKENEAESWRPLQGWLLRQRRLGRTVIFLHHAGKGGTQRGTSNREDVLDTVISLRHPNDYSPEQGARFEVHYEKNRNFYGEPARPFEARYEVRNNAAVWTRTEIMDAERARVVAALQDGMSIREAADALGIHRSKVERLRRKAMEAGEFAPTSEAAE